MHVVVSAADDLEWLKEVVGILEEEFEHTPAQHSVKVGSLEVAFGRDQEWVQEPQLQDPMVEVSSSPGLWVVAVL